MVAAIYTHEFERLWKAYPRKTGKGAAFHSFQKLKCTTEDVDMIIGVVEKYKQTDQWTRDSGQYVPHLSTFLHQRRFDDEPEVKTNLAVKTGGVNGQAKPSRAEQQFIDNVRAADQAHRIAAARTHRSPDRDGNDTRRNGLFS